MEFWEIKYFKMLKLYKANLISEREWFEFCQETLEIILEKNKEVLKRIKEN